MIAMPTDLQTLIKSLEDERDKYREANLKLVLEREQIESECDVAKLKLDTVHDFYDRQDKHFRKQISALEQEVDRLMTLWIKAQDELNGCKKKLESINNKGE